MKAKLCKIIAVYIVLNIIGQLLYPATSYALTSGPVSPEFSSFEPVVTTDMVNEFTGDFVYNIPVLNVPGPQGSGYAMSLSYHSGIVPEEEASWVGYGWTLNPGAINRQKHGFADDWNGASSTIRNKLPRNYTIGNSIYTGVSYDGVGINPSANFRYNNYKGFGFGFGIGLDVLGQSFGYNWDVNEAQSSFSVALNPAALATSVASMVASSGSNENANTENSSLNYGQQKASEGINRWKGELTSKLSSIGNNAIQMGSHYGLFAAGALVRPTSTQQFTGYNYQYNFQFSGGAWGWQWTDGYISSYSYMDYKDNVTNQKAYGFMYSHKATPSSGNARMDYCRENENPYQKSDLFLPIPFGNPDQFIATGQGMIGGFKLYNRNATHYAPTTVSATTTIKSVGNFINIGSDPISHSIGSGTSTMKTTEWAKTSDSYKFASSGDEPYFMRFDGDKGGNINISPYDGADKVDLKYIKGKDDNIEEYEYQADMSGLDYGSDDLELNKYGRVSRSSYIGYHTNSQINNGMGYNSDNSNVSSFIDRSETYIADGIGEIVTYNENGLRYNYSLPVYARNEGSLKYGLKESDEANIDENNFIVYKDISSDSKSSSIVGETVNQPYATSYLLTDITTPDYIDRSLNGPSDDDFGGYTKFNYTRVHGSKSKYSTSNTDWYRWRIPYDGLLYGKGELSTTMDDGGQVCYGEKEVYYLSSIETRTHIAKFITSDRLDGIDAASNTTAAKTKGSKGIHKLKKLDQIELYAKDASGNAGKLLQTINFSYDYSLMDGLPNSSGTKEDADKSKRAGKLTLKKVWTDYQGVYAAKISPYEFTYQYKQSDNYASSIESLYPDVVQYGKDFGSSNENPDYDNCNIDAWGNYQYNGGDRISKLRNWVTQNPDDNDFDPAAWHLKKIQLPSGGNILIQYEQKDYQYVQDYPAFAMVGLYPSTGNEDDYYQDELNAVKTGSDGKKYVRYYLNMSDYFGLDKNDASYSSTMSKWKDHLYDYFITSKRCKANPSTQDDNSFHNRPTNGNYLYSKFLFSYKGTTPGLDECTSEQISTYQSVQNVGYDSGKKLLYIDVDAVDMTAVDKKTTPARNAAIDFFKANRMSAVGNCWDDAPLKDIESNKTSFPTTVDMNEIATIDQAIGSQLLFCGKSSDFDIADFMGNVALLFTGAAHFGVWDEYVDALNNCTGDAFEYVSNTDEYDFDAYCKYMNTSKSYFKIPVLDKKLGGGVRVKRLLMYDEGIGGNSQDAALYGNEYVYQNEDGSSSGVAVNEPQAIREENGMIQLMDVSDRDLGEIFLYGVDRREISGTIGESILPGASVGYGRVVVKNIYSGKTNPGFQVKKFNTAYNYPVKYDITSRGEENWSPLSTLTLEDLLSNSGTHETIVLIYNSIKTLIDAFEDMFNGDNSFTNADFSDINDVTDLLDGIIDLLDSFRDSISSDAALSSTLGNLIDMLNHILTFINNCITDVAIYQASGSDGGSTITVAEIPLLAVILIKDFATLVASEGEEIWDLITESADFLGDAFVDIFQLDKDVEQNAYNELWARQGYSIIQNDMHGQPLSLETYEGNYDEINAPDDNDLSLGVYYAYVEPGDKVNIMDEVGEDYDSDYLGRTEVIAMESRQTTTVTNESTSTSFADLATLLKNIGINMDVVEQTTTIYNKESLCTHVTSKDIHYPAILKSVKTYRDGVSNTEKYDAFNKHSGQAVVTKTYDEYNGFDLSKSNDHNGTYTHYNIPASYQYKMMEPKAFNEGFRVSSKSDYNVQISLAHSSVLDQPYLTLKTTTTSADVNDIMDMLNKGDLLVIRGKDASNNTKTVYYHIDYMQYNYVYLKAVEDNQEQVSISDAAMEVLQSARTNQLNEIAGSFTTYGTKSSSGGPNMSGVTSSSNVNKAWNSAGVTFSSSWLKEFNSISDLANQLNDDIFASGLNYGYSIVYTYSGYISSYASGYSASSALTFKYLGLRLYAGAFTNSYTLEVNTGGKIVATYSINRNTHWYINETGQLVYELKRNGGISIEPETAWKVNDIDTYKAYDDYEMGYIVDATATRYSDDWELSDDLKDIYDITNRRDEYTTGAYGKWRPIETYRYNTSITNSGDDEYYRTYTSGYTDNFYYFDFLAESQHENWYKTSTVTAYSPYGDILEEKDQLGNYNCAKYGYRQSVPYLKAANANYDAVLYEGFENYLYFSGKYYFEDEYTVSTSTASINSTYAHSGSNSIEIAISTTATSLDLKTITFTDQLDDDGIVVMFWMRLDNESLNCSAKLTESSSKFTDVNFSKVARVGEWTLYSAELSSSTWSSTLTEGNTFMPVIKISGDMSSKIYLDDVRVQPYSAEMTCYVYDPNTLRLLTTFDSQHFGTFYQYNAEGKLIRKIAETEKGIRTISETHYGNSTETR